MLRPAPLVESRNPNGWATSPSWGTLATLDNEIDQTTGTVSLRAIFENADDALFPNQFVNVRLLVEEKHGDKQTA